MDIYRIAASFAFPTLFLIVFFIAGWRITRLLALKHVEMMENICIALRNQTTLLTRISEQNDLKERRHEDNVNRLEAVLARLETVCRHPETLQAVETKG